MLEETTTRSACLVCEEEKPSGILILGSFICEECEKKIIETRVHEKEYCGYLHKLKKIWEFVLTY